MTVKSLQRFGIASCVLGLIALLSFDQVAAAQQPLRPALPPRPNIGIPQQTNNRSPANNNPKPAENMPNGMGFNNSGFNPSPSSNRSSFEYGNNGWNSWGYNNWNGWNSYSNPYWNTFASFSTVNPALNGVWHVPNWQAWNVNPYLFNANLNGMWNNYNMNFGYSPFEFNYGLPVGAWNGFPPAMLFPNMGAANQDVPR
jgi:hypothetical protein